MIPFVLVVLAIYAIFFRRYKKVNFPEVVKMTPEHMSKCSDCSICFQTFVEEEKVIILKCSELHIFHETCIKGWGKIKANCPICRQGIEWLIDIFWNKFYLLRSSSLWIMLVSLSIQEDYSTIEDKWLWWIWLKNHSFYQVVCSVGSLLSRPWPEREEPWTHLEISPCRTRPGLLLSGKC